MRSAHNGTDYGSSPCGLIASVCQIKKNKIKIFSFIILLAAVFLLGFYIFPLLIGFS